MRGEARDEGETTRRVLERQRRLRCREVRIDLLLEAELDVGGARRGERAQTLAAPERQHQVVELADLRELGGKRVRRRRVHRHDLRLGAELSPCFDEPGFVAPCNGNPGA
jgi:hypothetical protein